ncbi:hypothetical protein [Bacteroides sp.]
MVTKRPFTPIQQLGLLKHEFPLSIGSVERGTMVWKCEFTPSVLSDTYMLKIVFSAGNFPRTYIVSPKPLPLAEGAKRLPHTYNYSNGKQQLCLFLPSANEWDSSMLISETIVHWAVQWMYFYEIWVSTGIWMGGGHGNWDVKKTLKQEKLVV